LDQAPPVLFFARIARFAVGHEDALLSEDIGPRLSRTRSAGRRPIFRLFQSKRIFAVDPKTRTVACHWTSIEGLRSPYIKGTLSPHDSLVFSCLPFTVQKNRTRMRRNTARYARFEPIEEPLRLLNFLPPYCLKLHPILR
jgi:hypothetical protein